MHSVALPSPPALSGKCLPGRLSGRHCLHLCGSLQPPWLGVSSCLLRLGLDPLLSPGDPRGPKLSVGGGTRNLTALFDNPWRCTALYYTALHYTLLQCTLLYRTALNITPLHYIIFDCPSRPQCSFLAASQDIAYFRQIAAVNP